MSGILCALLLQEAAVVVRGGGLAFTEQVHADGDAGPALDRLEAALKEAGIDPSKAVRLHAYAPEAAALEEAKRALLRRFPKAALTLVQAGLSRPSARVALDGVFEAPTGKASTSRVSILPAGPAVFLSGQAEQGETRAATRKTLAGLGRSLEHLGLSWADVVQLRTFIRDLPESEALRHEIAATEGARSVASSVILEWKLDPPIEIELVARARPSADPKEAIRFIALPGSKPSPVYSHATWVRGDVLIFTSGLSGVEGEVRELFASTRKLLEGLGSDLSHMAKATYFVVGDAANAKLTEARKALYDPARPPAASKAFVRGLDAPGRTLMLDLIAVPVR
jgi:enamine deaminase RidA (YjgF/YER057c/UK114 family)